MSEGGGEGPDGGKAAGGQRPDPATLAAQGGPAAASPDGDVVPPVRPATTFARDGAYALPGGIAYQRDESPALHPAEALLAELEAGAAAKLFASGMAAAAALVQALRPGDHIVAQDVMYWGLRGWLRDFCHAWGLALDFVPAGDPDALRAALRPGQTRLVWVETPSNPTWTIVDIAAAAEAAHTAGAALAVDSTVATPVHTRPLTLGADIVLHSATKYLNGHSDVVAGALVAADADTVLWDRVAANRLQGGALLGAFEAWLLLRGLRTLFLRVPRSSATALWLAEQLDGHPKLTHVLYPGLPAHPGHDLAARQMQGGFGGMLSLRVAGGRAAALRVACACRLFQRATSLGGVESLIEHRASTEGPDSPVPEDLLRLSVGIEAPADLRADLEEALAAL